MIILNTTFHIHSSIDAEVLDWIKRAYAASAFKAGAISKMLTRIVFDDTNTDGNGYALHLTFSDIATAKHWNDGVGQSLRKILTDRWGEKALTFHTYLEVLD